jgi:hypothetical protein
MQQMFFFILEPNNNTERTGCSYRIPQLLQLIGQFFDQLITDYFIFLRIL